MAHLLFIHPIVNLIIYTLVLLVIYYSYNQLSIMKETDYCFNPILSNFCQIGSLTSLLRLKILIAEKTQNKPFISVIIDPPK